ncbi:MAG: hypothetical protein P8L31_11200 [Pseudomonadales bacterium]|nr:hypothetical protein [Pseudomonadales bacterium]
MGGEQANREIDISVVATGEGSGGVEHGRALIEFVDAVIALVPEEIHAAREKLKNAIGVAGVVDAAAVLAMFQLNTRAADAAGIAIDDRTIEIRDQVGIALGFESRPEGIAP